MRSIKSQKPVLAGLVLLYSLGALIFILMPSGALDPGVLSAGDMPDIPPWQLALANAGLVLAVYLPVGLAGLWLARKASLPGLYEPPPTLKDSLLFPTGLGLAAGALIVALDLLFQRLGGGAAQAAFPHPPFPASLVASFTAAIGEEILFRLFLMSLWVVVLGWLSGRLAPVSETRRRVVWMANILAALAFAAAHLGTMMVLLDAATPAELPPLALVEMFLLNGIVGILAGERFARVGLVAAMGVHFWVDIVWHVLYPSL